MSRLSRPDPLTFLFEDTAPEIVPEYADVAEIAAVDASAPDVSATSDAPTPVDAPPPVTLDAKQQHAIDLALTTPYTDISGTAGVGKTFVAREILRRYEATYGPGTCVLAATTGIAAVNLGEGTTINALLKYFDTAALRANYTAGHTQAVIRKLRRLGVRRILLDEKSMLSGEQFGYIVKAIREVNDGEIAALESVGDDSYMSLTAQEERDLPPIGLTLVGDFGQLPPVPDTDRAGKKLPVTFCFDSPQWEIFKDTRTVLDRIYRQDAGDFIAALHAVRRGDVRSALAFFTPDRFSSGMEAEFPGTTIFPKNDMVERYNLDRLERLATPAMTYLTAREGQQRGDWKQIPDALRLKEQALVMILANRRTAGDEDEPGRMIYANGDLGILQAAGENGWWVQLHRTGETVCVRPVTRENLIPLEPGRRKELKALGIAEQAIVDNKFESIGRVTYMPLRAAYGCTVHKCLLAGTRVPVLGRGLLPVEDIRVGDVVVSGLGNPCRVIAAQPTGIKELVRVVFASGRELLMSPDHPLMDEHGVFVHGVDVGQRVQIGQETYSLEYWSTHLPVLVHTPRGDVRLQAPEDMTPDLAWWLGAVLGDGSVRDRRDGTIEFHSREPELIARFTGYAELYFNAKVKRYKKSSAIIAKAVRQWLEALGVDYVTAASKTVPEAIFRSPARCRAEFLRGLFDTDGSVDARQIRYVTTSKRLAQSVQVLLDSLGVTETKIVSQIPMVVYKGTRRTGQRAWTVCVQRKGFKKFESRVGFFHAAKAKTLAELAAKPVRELPSNATCGRLDRIVEIVKTDLHVPLHDLEVEGDHSFIANGLVVSNTQGLTLDNVQVNINDSFMKQPGMLFVALSRARTADGLRIVGSQRGFVERCTVERRVQPWL